MTPKEFFDKVVEMRRCQKEYLKNKRQIDLRISKQIEREVDEEVAIPMKRLVSIVRKLFVFLVLHVETAFTPKNTLMFASVLATPNGQCFLNLNL